MSETYISVNRAILVLKKKCEQDLINFAMADSIATFIDKQPTADVQEVKHGKWIKDKTQKRDDGEIYDYCCSLCCGLASKDDYDNLAILSSYCPHCGAKMDGKD